VPTLAVRLMLGKKRRARRPDVRVLRAEQRFGLQDVRAAREKVRRQAGRNVGEDLLPIQRHCRRQVRRQRLAEEQDETILGLRPRARLRGEIRVRLLDHRQRLLQRELGRGAGVELQLHDLVGGLGRGERLARHAELLVEREHQQVLVRDLRDEQDLRRAPRFAAGEVLLERRLVQAAQAAEEVEFPRRLDAADQLRCSTFAFGLPLAGLREADRSANAATVG